MEPHELGEAIRAFVETVVDGVVYDFVREVVGEKGGEEGARGEAGGERNVGPGASADDGAAAVHPNHKRKAPHERNLHPVLGGRK